MNETMFYNLKGTPAMVPSLASQVASEIGRRIVNGDYCEGSLIEDEGSLAVRYGVSRTAIRDAVKILSGKGLLGARRGIGTLVKPRNAWGLLDSDVLAWHQAAPANADFLRQLMEIRQIFEPMAAFFAAQRASDDDIAAINAACQRMEDEKGLVEHFIYADAMFHRSILNSTGNFFMSTIEGVVFSALLASIKLTNRDPRDNKDSIPFHRDVADAIREHNPDKAKCCMEILLSDAARRLSDLNIIVANNSPNLQGR